MVSNNLDVITASMGYRWWQWWTRMEWSRCCI